MKKTCLFLLPLALILGAYSGDSFAQGSEGNKTSDKTLKCEGDPQAPMVTLNLEADIKKPECVLANLGSTIVFRLVPKKDLKRGLVKIDPVNPLDVWLQGSNDEIVDIIVIQVPGEHDPGNNNPKHTDHDYLIKVPGRSLDPRVRVEH